LWMCECLRVYVWDGLQVVAVGIWLLSYVVDWLHELELGARYCVSCPGALIRVCLLLVCLGAL
jgi:hypothetical protein